ncbi:uncharacterized protein [Periplaneta americana]|uniref:uncharacterized protein isoform X2 n=1 Tax=Periplaneta americana TaxID=6978 RepID=UPI0037E8BA63
MSASGRYLEYIQVNSKNVIVEVRVLESKVTVCGKQIATNKWLLPTQWQEVYSILHTGAEYCMNSKDRTTLVASGKDVEVALMFKPYLAVYQYVMQPYSISGIVEAVEDSGNGWIESKPYKVMIIASVAPKRNSDIWSAEVKKALGSTSTLPPSHVPSGHVKGLPLSLPVVIYNMTTIEVIVQ